MSCNNNELIMEILFQEGIDKDLTEDQAIIYAKEQFDLIYD
tara:strand:+ start:1138 stop:1260 length:123 start_codon:yes stop_codon:yes gene_type:complete